MENETLIEERDRLRRTIEWAHRNLERLYDWQIGGVSLVVAHVREELAKSIGLNVESDGDE